MTETEQKLTELMAGTFDEIFDNINKAVISSMHTIDPRSGEVKYEGPIGYFDFNQNEGEGPFTMHDNVTDAFNLNPPVSGRIKHEVRYGRNRECVFRGVIGYAQAHKAIDPNGEVEDKEKLIDTFKMFLNQILPHMYRKIEAFPGETFIGDYMVRMRYHNGSYFRELTDAHGFEWRLSSSGCPLYLMEKREEEQ